jgi:hypothetical protein
VSVSAAPGTECAVTRYVVTRVTLCGAILALVLAVEYAASEATGFRRTQITFLLTALALLGVLARLAPRWNWGKSLGGIWRRHMRWAARHPSLAAGIDAAMIFTLVLTLAVGDGFGYALWNAVACGVLVGGASAVEATQVRRHARRESLL